MSPRLASTPPPDLDQARGEFARWRRGRPRGARIPSLLWRRAVGLAQSQGVSKTSQALHLDYYSLQRRLSETGPVRSTPVADFVELALPAAPREARCRLEIADAGGGSLRVDLSGLSASDLAIIVRAVAGRSP